MAHPSSAADHTANRAKVCAPCGLKAKNVRPISGNILSAMIKFFPNYDITDDHFPTAICNTCRIKINDAINDDKVFPVQMLDYENIVLLKDTRSSIKKKLCYCHICLKARSTVQSL